MFAMLARMTANILQHTEFSVSAIQARLDELMSKKIDFADFYLQNLQGESWSIEDSLVKHGSFFVDAGFGLRVIAGEQAAYANSNNVTLEALDNAMKTVLAVRRQGQQAHVKLSAGDVKALYPGNSPLSSLQDAEKIALLQQIDTSLRQKDSRVRQVIARLSACHDDIWLQSSGQAPIVDQRPMVSLRVTIIVEQNGATHHASAGVGLRNDYRILLENLELEAFLDKLLRQALLQFEAKPAFAGTFPVVLAPGWPAVLLHEAVGHGLEADFNRKGSSVFSDKLGEQVAAKGVTVVDDATLVDRRGSLAVDDEGVAGQYTVLIEDGVLKGYMQDRQNAMLMGQQSTGNGRRESYAYPPMPRMTNTYMLPGEYDQEEIIASMDKGIYAVDFSGGQVDITSGNFVFTTQEAYWVEHGKIQYPIKQTTLAGNGPDVIQRISMVGNDLALDPGIGVCGKAGQSVPVGVGQPTLRIDEITVGGQALAD